MYKYASDLKLAIKRILDILNYVKLDFVLDGGPPIPSAILGWNIPLGFLLTEFPDLMGP